MTIKELRTQTGLSQVKFAQKYGIPKRTLEHWEASGEDKRKPPDYLIKLLERVINLEDAES